MRNYVMELLGSFFLTTALVTGNPVAAGLMLVVLMYLGRPVSGGQFNPAISVALFVRKAIKFDELMMYIAVQVIGAFFGLWLFAWITQDPFTIDAVQEVSSQAGLAGVFVLEMILFGLFGLLWLALTSGTQYKASDLFGVVIGLGFMAILYLYNGGMFNPAVPFASWLYNWVTGVQSSTKEVFVYIIAPLLGGALSAFAYDFFYKKGAK